MKRSICLCVFAFFAGALHPLDAAQSRPNILVILIDDLGWKDLGCYGSEFYRTPNIDKLASQGVRFTDGYAACAVCSPTRASILTGKYPARLMLTEWLPSGRWNPKAKTPQRTFSADAPARRVHAGGSPTRRRLPDWHHRQMALRRRAVLDAGTSRLRCQHCSQRSRQPGRLLLSLQRAVEYPHNRTES